MKAFHNKVIIKDLSICSPQRFLLDLGMEDNWKSLEDLIVDETVNQIHCDTRDFHCLIETEPLNTKDAANPDITRVLYNSNYWIDDNEIINWLIYLEDISGGKAEWRAMYFKNYKDGWFKYIRFYRHPKHKNQFIVCDRHSKPILWKHFTEENLDKEHLMTH